MLSRETMQRVWCFLFMGGILNWSLALHRSPKAQNQLKIRYPVCQKLNKNYELQKNDPKEYDPLEEEWIKYKKLMRKERRSPSWDLCIPAVKSHQCSSAHSPCWALKSRDTHRPHIPEHLPRSSPLQMMLRSPQSHIQEQPRVHVVPQTIPYCLSFFPGNTPYQERMPCPESPSMQRNVHNILDVDADHRT